MKELLLWPVFYWINCAIELLTSEFLSLVSDTLNPIISLSNIKSECEVFIALWSLNEPVKCCSVLKTSFLIIQEVLMMLFSFPSELVYPANLIVAIKSSRNDIETSVLWDVLSFVFSLYCNLSFKQVEFSLTNSGFKCSRTWR